MTNEEAKKRLEELIQDRKSFICGGDDGIYRKDLEALKKAVEVFEKQIPKKPIRLLYHEVGDCPFCETTVYISEDGFCPSCGQALDWGDNSDE